MTKTVLNWQLAMLMSAVPGIFCRADEPKPELLNSGVDDVSFRALAIGSDSTVFVGGTNGTVLRSADSGATWDAVAVGDATSELDFRDVEVASDGSVVLMSAGPGETSRLFHSEDGGTSWRTVHRNLNPKGFFNGLAFWENGKGLVIGDPIDGKLFLMLTADFGRTWNVISGPQMMEGEYGFAASGTGIVAGSNGRAWVATGAAASRVLVTDDYGKSWAAVETGVRHGQQGAGIFSIAVRGKSAVVVGGNYEQPKLSSKNCAVSDDAGKSWSLPDVQMPHKACVRWLGDSVALATGRTGIMKSIDKGRTWSGVSSESFYVFDFDEASRTAFLAGASGRIARLSFGDDLSD